MLAAAAALIILAPSIVSATDCRLFTVGECTPSNEIWVDEVTKLSPFFPTHFHFLFLQNCVVEVTLLSLFFPPYFHFLFLQICVDEVTVHSLFFTNLGGRGIPCIYFLCHSLSLF